MFKRGKQTDEAIELTSLAADHSNLVDASPIGPLSPDKVRRTVDPARLGFKTTAELEPTSGLIGQERALKAIEFGADIKSHDFNMFVLGPPASGKSSAVKAYLRKLAADSTAPDDWVYVNNFEDFNKPRALRLPHGRAPALDAGMIDAIDDLRSTLPAVFEADDYQVRARTINEEFRSGHEEALEALNEKANAQNIAILKTPQGFAMAPMSEGKVVKPETYNEMPEDMRKDVEKRIEELQRELEDIMHAMPKRDKERRTALRKLAEDVATDAVEEALADVRNAFADEADVLEHLKAVEEDLINNVSLFVSDEQAQEGEEDGQAQAVAEAATVARDPRYRRYMVNIVTTPENGNSNAAPIIEELNPNYGSLIGRIEHIAQMGTLVTDFLLVKPGALHRANGGYLLLDARKVLLSPYTWEALKRAIKAQEIRIERPAETVGFATTQSLDPTPIPLQVKVILFGDRQLYYALLAGDPDFPGIFKVQADFDDTIERNDENDLAYARLIRSVTDRHDLKPLDASAVARVIEEGARLADDRERLSIEVGRIADIVREADYWAGKAKHKTIAREDVERAIDERVQRADRLRDRGQEIIDRDIVMIDTDGSSVGQINALSVLQLGDFSYGKPTRITARTRLGGGRVTDIEREVKLGGPLHSKGVMILWGFLAGRYAQDVPLALAASLVFEQSYGGVDGDSASSTELYALMSALSEVPIRQSLAVTGSVNQNGEVQAIGGANEKIEGFYDVCKAKGMTGDQGVLIPKANEQHLMLRADVVEAIEAGQFAIYAVGTIDEGIELLTGIKAGERDEATGQYPPGTINRLVEDKLRAFALRTRSFNHTAPGYTDGAATS